MVVASIEKFEAQAGKAQYEKAVVSFIDILGFREKVRATMSPSELHRMIKSISQFVFTDVQAEGDEEGPPELESISFSDNVVRVVRAGKDNLVRALASEVLSLARIQSHCAGKGVLVRGGVAYGDIYLKDGEIFGPALVDAYDLESSQALFPRILISPDLVVELECLKEKKFGHWWAYNPFRSLRESEDGMWHVDYLGSAEASFEAGNDEIERRLRGHKHCLVREIASEKNVSVLRKLLWAAKYHNESCQWLVRRGSGRAISDRDSFLREFVILSEDVPSRPFTFPNSIQQYSQKYRLDRL